MSNVVAYHSMSDCNAYIEYMYDPLATHPITCIVGDSLDDFLVLVDHEMFTVRGDLARLRDSL